MDVVDNHDAYFAKYYPNGNFDKHNIVEESEDATAPMAGSYFNMDIVNDHDAYYTKYYPNGNFNKHDIIPQDAFFYP